LHDKSLTLHVLSVRGLQNASVSVVVVCVSDDQYCKTGIPE